MGDTVLASNLPYPKSCPLCGSARCVMTWGGYDLSGCNGEILCVNCGARGPHIAEREPGGRAEDIRRSGISPKDDVELRAVAAWNRRVHG